MIKTGTEKTEASLQQYKEFLELKLKELAQAVAYRVSVSAIDATPIGDPEGGTKAYKRLYQERFHNKGYRVEPGLAKGSWVLSLNNQVSQGAVLYDDPNGTKAKGAAVSALRSFNLGDSIIINNSLDYISDLEGGSSGQAPDGIRKPAMDQIKSVYKIDIQRVLNETKYKY